MRDYTYHFEQGVHQFVFLETGSNPFRVLCDHIERIIIAENPHAKATCYLLDMRLADFHEPMYEIVGGLRGISTRHPNRPATALALVVRPHPLNRVLNVTMTLVSRKVDQFKIFDGNSMHDTLSWLKSIS